MSDQHIRRCAIKESLKALARGTAAFIALPFIASFYLKAIFMGKDKALLSSSQTLSILPGLTGQYLRRAFLRRTISECHNTAVIEFGVLFSKVGAIIKEKAYIGPYCQIGLARIERNVMLAPSVHVPSGPRIHGTLDASISIQDQPGTIQMTTVGEGSWIGSSAVIMADVGRHTIIGAGAVVTKPIPDYVLAGGVPAQVIRNRSESIDATIKA